MKIATVTLKSLAPYSQSKKHSEPTKSKEGHEAYSRRTWPAHMHVTDDGYVFIPPMAFNQAIQKAASYLRLRIPGKGNSEYQKHFMGGVTCEQDGMILGIKAKDVEPECIYANLDGKRGGSKRGYRWYPTIPEWTGTCTFYIFDDVITEDVFEQVLIEAGRLIGVGRFRAERGGLYGRWEVVSIEWEEVA